MKVKMTLLSDSILGNGMSVPGAEDISVLTDAYGFPYFKGGTLKGIFREELFRLLELEGMKEEQRKEEVGILLGSSEQQERMKRKLTFSDFQMSEKVRAIVKEEIGGNKPGEILDLLSNLRTFTKMNEEGVVEDGTLRIARCVNKGLVFYGEIQFDEGNTKDKERIEDVLGMIKYIGTMRNRGFGKVKFETVKGEVEHV